MVDKDYFQDRISVKGDCWEWQLSVSEHGYGRMKHRGKMYGAHRMSYMVHKGEIPEGMLVCHTCDNPPCVNPEHLWVGTDKDNNHDMIRKGRQKYNMSHNEGNNYGGRKILAGGIEFTSYTKAGKHFGVSDNAIRKRIKLGWEGYSKI